MPVIVTGRLIRSGGVYLAGETVEAEISVHNLVDEAEGDETPQSLAWCSVQVHCQEILNEQRIRPPPDSKRDSMRNGKDVAGTSFVPGRGESGLVVYTSRPSILFCDLSLKPNETVKYVYKETLPSDEIPPSFKGHAVKYLYKVTIGVQHVNSPVKLIRIPFRVLVLSGLSHVCLDDRNISPSNPFLKAEYSKATILEIASQVIENITSIRNCHVYNITTAKGKVGQFTLFKNCFKLGEDVSGLFSFENSEINCFQYLVSLQTEEEVAEEYRSRLGQRPTISTIAKHHAVSLCYKESEVKLSIPFSATPTFFSDVVHLKWRIHFEFVTSATPLPSCPDFPPDDVLHWEAPSEICSETMVWDLPIKVYPCSSLNACLGSTHLDNAISVPV